MKRFLSLLLSSLTVLAILTGCGEKAPSYDATAEYTNLADTASQEEVAELMTNCGISAQRQHIFFDHVNQFNKVAGSELLTDGFQRRNILSPLYDPYDLQDLWTSAYPDFLGYNCRITAFSLFSDFLEFSLPMTDQLPDTVLMDYSALEADPSAFPDQLEQFCTFYNAVPTENTKDISVHVSAFQEALKNRGISFHENPQIRLISMVFHDIPDEQGELFIGHTGILFPTQDGTLYFVEKLAFQEPYQCVKFQDRTELSNYLMTKYDLNVDQPMASPFIMENDQLMEGYGPRPELN